MGIERLIPRVHRCTRGFIDCWLSRSELWTSLWLNQYGSFRTTRVSGCDTLWKETACYCWIVAIIIMIRRPRRDSIKTVFVFLHFCIFWFLIFWFLYFLIFVFFDFCIFWFLYFLIFWFFDFLMFWFFDFLIFWFFDFLIFVFFYFLFFLFFLFFYFLIFWFFDFLIFVFFDFDKFQM
jgi:hypothetical protein